MTGLADPRPHDDAFVTALTGAGLIVGDAAKPTVAHGWQGTPGQSTFIAYVIVYPLSQAFDGPLAGAFEDSTFGWQVTCVAETRERCDWLRNKVNQTVIGRELVVAGRSVPLIRPDGGSGTPRPDDTVSPRLFMATPRYSATSV